MHNSTFFRSHEARQQIIVLAGTPSPSKLQFCERDKELRSVRTKLKISAKDFKMKPHLCELHYSLGHFRSYNNQSKIKNKTECKYFKRRKKICIGLVWVRKIALFLWYFVLFIGVNRAREDEKETVWETKAQTQWQRPMCRCSHAPELTDTALLRATEVIVVKIN